MALSLAADAVVKRTLPDHRGCSAHQHYKLSCAQYERLIARSGQECEICGHPSSKMPQGKLYIDHDRQWWGVRGLLCISCNSRLSYENEGQSWCARYVANSWWRQECKRLDLPAERSPEPPVGSAIRNQFGTVWIHSCGTIWSAIRQNGHGWQGYGWSRLYNSFGPHNLMPLDLKALVRTSDLPPDLQKVKDEIERGPYWAEVRNAIDLKEWVRPQSRPKPLLPWLETPATAARALRAIFPPAQQIELAWLLLSEGTGEDT